MGTNTKSSARIMDATRHLVRAIAGSARAVESRSGISGAQLFILSQLDGSESPLSVGELATRTFTHQSTVSGVVSALVARGLVTRKHARDDARRVEVALTTSGRTLLAHAPTTVQAQLVRGLGRLDAATRAGLAEGLELWLAEAGLGGEVAPLFFEPDGAESR